MQTMKVYLDEGAFELVREHPTDAGLDLKCIKDTYIWAGGSATFDTGVHIELPEGMYANIESKSGLNFNYSIVSCGGTIDEGYTGAIQVKLYNFGKEGHLFKRGDKIAQLVVKPYCVPAIIYDRNFKETARGDSGFGSTGR